MTLEPGEVVVCPSIQSQMEKQKLSKTKTTLKRNVTGLMYLRSSILTGRVVTHKYETKLFTHTQQSPFPLCQSRLEHLTWHPTRSYDQVHFLTHSPPHIHPHSETYSKPVTAFPSVSVAITSMLSSPYLLPLKHTCCPQQTEEWQPR